MLEKVVEAKHRKAIKRRGGISYKFTVPNRRHVPDRLDLNQIAPEHVAIVSQYIWFTETKKPGAKPRPGQLREHERIRKLGFRVEVKDK